MSIKNVGVHKGYTSWMGKENAAAAKSIESRKGLEWRGTPIPEEVIYKGVRLVMSGPPLDAVKVKNNHETNKQ